MHSARSHETTPDAGARSRSWLRRLAFAACALVAIALGLASRRFGAQLPTFIADFAGDTLWATTAFLALSALIPDAPRRIRAALALAGSIAVEVSQLYHAPWIDSIRATTVGALLLGSGFLWTDLVCYAAGVMIGAVGEALVRRRLLHAVSHLHDQSNSEESRRS
jgi:hypothetical protein